MRKPISAKHIKITLWIFFIFCLFTCLIALNYFQQQSRQLLGSNFTALAVDIAQAKEDLNLLKRSNAYLKQDSPFFNINEFTDILIRLEYRLPLLTRKIGQVQLDDNTYKTDIETLDKVRSQMLFDIKQRIENYKQNLSEPNRTALVTEISSLELALAVTYSDLHNAIQTASDIERRLKSNLTFLIWGLTITILFVLFVLLLVLTRLFDIKETLTIQNNRDHLTQLPNRRCITEQTQDILLNNPAQISFAILDLDFFKKINDLYGHPAGDEVLINTAKLLTTNTHGTNLVARLGGEEFCVLFVNQSKEEVLKQCEAIRSAVEHTKIKVNNSTLIHITTSIGLYHHTGAQKTTFSQIYQYADNALYSAKKSGRNRICLHGDTTTQCINTYPKDTQNPNTLIPSKTK